jgi:hypothetical protein
MAADTAEIKFVPGTFQSFRTTTKIHLGKIIKDLKLGDVVQFDGQTLKVEGVDYAYPEFRAAFKAGVGWAVPEVDNISSYTAKSTDAKVRPALDSKKNQGKHVPITVSDDEKDVGPARRVVKADDPDEAKVVGSFSKKIQNMDDVEKPVGPSTKRAMEVKSDSVGNEDAVTVGKIRTPAVMKTVVSDGAQAAREAARLDEVPPPRAILNSPKGEIHAAESEDVGSIIDSLNPEDHARMVRDQRKAQPPKTEAQDHGSVDWASQVAEARQILAEDARRWEAKVAEARQILAEDARRPAVTTASPVSVRKEAPKHPRTRPVTVEEVIMRGTDIDLGDGVMWDKNLHWKTRAKIAAEQYRDNPKILAAIRQAESPAVNALISERITAITGKAA